MKYIKKINELQISKAVDFYDKFDRLAIYAAEKFFNMDGANLKMIGKGSEGRAYTDGDKVIKITEGIEEAGRAERLRGKQTRNLISYYSVHEMSHYGKTYWALHMDLLPNIVSSTTPHKYIFTWLRNRFGNFNRSGFTRTNTERSSDIFKLQQDRMGLIINTRSRDRMKAVKQAVDLMFKDKNVLSRVNDVKLEIDDIREITYNMLYDLINMNFEMKKFDIKNDDLHAGNLGITEDGRIVYFDIGYMGTGMKKIGDARKHIIKDTDTDEFKPKSESMINEGRSESGRDKLAVYLSHRYFHYDKDDIEKISTGTKGTAYTVDNGKKVLKLTRDKHEAGRAERIRTKHSENLISYYDVRHVKSKKYGDWYVLLMDKLPYTLPTYKNGKGYQIYQRFLREFGDIALDKSEDYSGEMPGSDIEDIRDVKRFIHKRVYEQNPGSTFNWKVYNRELVASMWLDIIKIRRQLSRFGIITHDLTEDNLGFTEDGKLVFYDIGYPGTGRKKITKKSGTIQIDDIPVSGLYAIGKKYLKQFES